MDRLTKPVLLGVTVLLCAVVVPLCATGEPDALYCAPEAELLDKHTYLKALSLDLRGEGPSLEENDLIALQDDVPMTWIEDWLNSEAFAKQVARFHRSLLWNRVTGTRLVPPQVRLHTQHGPFQSPALSNRWRAELLRGVYHAPCLDKPAAFDPESGELLFEENPVTGAMQEGWVEVHPYWAPDTTVKVCAADARTTLTAADGTSCKSRLGLSRPLCGCGPNLNWCVNDGAYDAISNQLGFAIDVRVEKLIENDEPYTHLFLDNHSYMNGPLIHYWRHLAHRYDEIYTDPVPVPAELLPTGIAFTQSDTWVPVKLGSEHAGVLTSAAYLMRHTSLRRRAVRFTEGLLCQPFVLPEGALTLKEEGLPDPDVTQRPGCDYCHAILEPTAQHWGRWAEFGMSYLSPKTHPPCRPDCQSCATEGGCSTDCLQNYVTQGVLTKELKYLGWLKTYQFNVDDIILDNIKTVELESKIQCAPEEVAKTTIDTVYNGPQLLATKAIFDGRLAGCAARNAVGWLMGREPLPEESAWIQSLAALFKQSGYDYKTLVKEIVTDERYRRVQ